MQNQYYDQWIKDDAKVASFIACAILEITAEFVLTCKHAKEIWKKTLQAMLIEQVYKVERDQTHDFSSHISKIPKKC